MQIKVFIEAVRTVIYILNEDLGIGIIVFLFQRAVAGIDLTQYCRQTAEDINDILALISPASKRTAKTSKTKNQITAKKTNTLMVFWAYIYRRPLLESSIEQTNAKPTSMTGLRQP
jgi:hypothetical protein